MCFPNWYNHLNWIADKFLTTRSHTKQDRSAYCVTCLNVLLKLEICIVCRLVEGYQYPKCNLTKSIKVKLCEDTSLHFKDTRYVTMNIFSKKYFLFKSFVKVELSYVFIINMFSTAENCMEM